VLKALADQYHWLPGQVLELPAAQFWAVFMPSRLRRPTTIERLNEYRNRQRIKAGKPPLPLR
jgi:hypothetical protein